MSRFRIASGLALVAGLTAASIWALWPEPQAVDLATVTRGPMEGVLSAEGVTRVRDPYTITAPITGATTRSPVAVGDSVQVMDGPFSDWMGVINEINHEKGKLKVMISIFGKETPVELDFLQVKQV